MTIEASPTTPRRAGRPARIAEPDVVRVALAIADEEGIENLSLRAVADRLAVTPASLYRLIEGPQDLHRIVVEAVLEEAVAALVLPRDWRAATEAIAHVIRAALLRHPLLVQAYQRNLVRSPGADRAVDAVLSHLLDAGLGEKDVVDVYAAVHAYVIGYTAFEHRRQVLDPAAYARGTVDPRVLRVRQHFADRYYGPEGFQAGLRLLLDGIAQQIGR